MERRGLGTETSFIEISRAKYRTLLAILYGFWFYASLIFRLSATEYKE
jgi:hypothetical protein